MDTPSPQASSCIGSFNHFRQLQKYKKIQCEEQNRASELEKRKIFIAMAKPEKLSSRRNTHPRIDLPSRATKAPISPQKARISFVIGRITPISTPKMNVSGSTGRLTDSYIRNAYASFHVSERKKGWETLRFSMVVH